MRDSSREIKYNLTWFSLRIIEDNLNHSITKMWIFWTEINETFIMIDKELLEIPACPLCKTDVDLKMIRQSAQSVVEDTQ